MTTITVIVHGSDDFGEPQRYSIPQGVEHVTLELWPRGKGPVAPNATAGSSGYSVGGAGGFANTSSGGGGSGGASVDRRAVRITTQT
jgi:hypothetical protein